MIADMSCMFSIATFEGEYNFSPSLASLEDQYSKESAASSDSY